MEHRSEAIQIVRNSYEQLNANSEPSFEKSKIKAVLSVLENKLLKEEVLDGQDQLRQILNRLGDNEPLAANAKTSLNESCRIVMLAIIELSEAIKTNHDIEQRRVEFEIEANRQWSGIVSQ